MAITYRGIALELIDRVAAGSHKIVPVNPTPEMLKAGIDADDERTGGQTCAHIYRAMLKAVSERNRATQQDGE